MQTPAKAILKLLTALALTPLAMYASAQQAAPQVLTFKLSLSNMHAIKGSKTILIDAGSKSDLPALESELKQSGIKWKDISAVVITHAHSDHAALANSIRQRSGATIIVGHGDIDMAAAGHNDDLKPTNLMAT